jgi:hypothetical protein
MKAIPNQYHAHRNFSTNLDPVTDMCRENPSVFDPDNIHLLKEFQNNIVQLTNHYDYSDIEADDSYAIALKDLHDQLVTIYNYFDERLYAKNIVAPVPEKTEVQVRCF